MRSRLWHRGYLSLSTAPLPTQSSPEQQSMGAICSTNPEDDPSDDKLKNSEKHISAVPRFLQNVTNMVVRTPAAAGLGHCYNFDQEPWSSVLGQRHAPSGEEQRKRDSAEMEANRRLQNARKNDIVNIFQQETPLAGFQNQQHPRKPGDHFLSNVDLINGPKGSYRPQEDELVPKRSHVLQIVERMPKGAHLHVHFNANLDPNFLLAHAEQEQLMTIISNKPLADKTSFDSCEIQFLLLPPDREQPYSVFDKERYSLSAEEDKISKDKTRKEEQEKITNLRRMSFKRFCEEWDIIRGCFDETWTTFTKSEPLLQMEKQSGYSRTEEQWSEMGTIMQFTSRDWLVRKLVFHAEEAHDCHQDQDGSWAKFNGRTRMMKGLFNYESAYRAYTRQCLQQFVDENVQYAEIRPNFMANNQIFSVLSDGKSLSTLTNADTVKIIVEEYEAFRANLDARRARGVTKQYFGGLKVIYCTPRSFSRSKIEDALQECFEFKQRWPKYIAGFDLVGEESKGQPLSYFREQLDAFQAKCDKAGVKIPFLLHCGETDDDPDNNLETALQLKNTPRLGHGFALLSKPQLRDEVIRKRICIESCPISNEILGLSSHPSKHAIYGLLNSGYHCTLNSDNATLFRSTLSHDFYQFLMGRGKGKQAMTLQVCKQLIMWSIEHSCMDDTERQEVRNVWSAQWDEFIAWVNQTTAFETAAETQDEKSQREQLEKLNQEDAEVRDKKVAKL